MKKIILISAIIFIACNTKKKYSEHNLLGEYIYSGELGEYTSLIISEDNNYHYQSKFGLTTSFSKGQWRIEGKYILLTSEKQLSNKVTDSYEILDMRHSDDSLVKIRVVNSDLKPIPFAECVISTSKDKLRSLSSKDGICNFKDLGVIDTITISCLGFKEVRVTSLSTNNFFIIQMRQINESYDFFLNERWKIKNKKLIRVNPNGKKYVYNKQ